MYKGIYGSRDPVEFMAQRDALRHEIRGAQERRDETAAGLLLEEHNRLGKEISVETYVHRFNRRLPISCPCCKVPQSKPLIVQGDGSTEMPLRLVHDKDSDPTCKLRTKEREHSQRTVNDPNDQRLACLADPVVMTRTIQLFRNIIGPGSIDRTKLKAIIDKNDKADFWRKVHDKNNFPFQLLVAGGPYTIRESDGSEAQYRFA